MANIKLGHWFLITIAATLMLTVYSSFAADLNTKYGVTYVDSGFNNTLAGISEVQNKSEAMRSEIASGENSNFWTILFNAGGIVVGLVTSTFDFVVNGLISTASLVGIPIGIMALIVSLVIVTISLLVMAIIFKWDII